MGSYVRRPHEIRLDKRSASEINDGENPWYPWKIRKVPWIDYRDEQTAAVLDKKIPDWRKYTEEGPTEVDARVAALEVVVREVVP